MKKFRIKKLLRVPEDEHKERLEKGKKYAAIYQIAKASGQSEEESRLIAAGFDVAGTVKNKVL